MQVELFKKISDYKDKQGNEKKATHFYLKAGSALIPIDVSFFSDPDGKDKQYAGRKSVLSAFASDLPEKTN